MSKFDVHVDELTADRDPIEVAILGFAHEFWSALPHAQEFVRKDIGGCAYQACIAGTEAHGSKWVDIAPAIRAAITAYLRAEASREIANAERPVSNRAHERAGYLICLAAEVEREQGSGG